MGCASSSQTSVEKLKGRPQSRSQSREKSRPGSRPESDSSLMLSREATAMTFTSEADRLGYPLPYPPRLKKSEIFQIEQYGAIDKRATKVPHSVLYGSYEDISAHLTKGCKNDVAKIRALFRWVTSLDLANLQSTLHKLPDSGTPLDYLLRIHWRMGNHAHFFAQLARAAGMPAVIITGMNKSAAYQLGGRMNKQTMSAQWNAVYVDGDWRLIDVFWASTCVIGRRSGDWSLTEGDADGASDDEEDQDEEDGEGETMHMVNEFFFLTDPDMLICTHFPDNELWQLLSEPLGLREFESRVYTRERFFQLGLYMIESSAKQCFIETNDGRLQIEFGIPGHIGVNAQFKYLLFKAKQSDSLPVPLERFVFYEKTKDRVRYTMKFPIAGRFKMDIFGQNEATDDTYDLVCSYLIDCPSSFVDVQPLPDCPDIGWGPGVEAEKAGLKAKSHKEAVIDTSTGEVQLRFDLSADAKAITHNMRSNHLDEWLLNRHAIVKKEDGQLLLDVRLPENGEYALKLFADDSEDGDEMPNVCNYLIRCKEKNIKHRPFPKLHEGTLGASFLAHTLGVDAISHQGGLIKTSDGKLCVKFVKQNDVELFCELHHNDIDKAELSNHILTKDDGKTSTFDIALPKKGEYAMNILAQQKGDKTRLYHVHTYLVESEQNLEEDVKTGKSDVPTVVLPTPNDSIEVRVPVMGGPLMGELRKKNTQEAPKKNQLKGKRDGKQDVFNVQLPELGEYQLDVFEEKNRGTVEHMCTFFLVRHEPLPGDTRPPSPQEEQEQNDVSKDVPHQPKEKPKEKKIDPEEVARKKKEKDIEARNKAFKEQLNTAISSQDVLLLQQAIKEFEAHDVPDKGELNKAKQLLCYLRVSQELTGAMNSHDLPGLEKAILAAEEANLQKRLGLQLQMAKKILEQLKRIEKLKHDILKLDQKTIAELKSYTQPPEVVHQVMAATFLLLGESDLSVRDWRAVQSLIGRTGKQSLKRRVSEFNVEKLKMQLSLKVKKMLSKFGASDVQGVSAGAATFYVWTMGMIEESESRFVDGGGDLKQLQARMASRKK